MALGGVDAVPNARQRGGDEASVWDEGSQSFDVPLASAFASLSRDAEWTRTDAREVGFDTHHPQGMSRVGDRLFLSSVEVVEEPGRYTDCEGDEGTPGRGVGHLFEMSLDGELLDRTRLDEGPLYHPGGIDYDGSYLWVPVAAYMPDSRGIVYRVDPETLEATLVLRADDHIGGVIRDAESNVLYGVNWGSRTFYRWELTDSLRPKDTTTPLAERGVPNPQHYVDYQDCQYLGNDLALCSGVAGYEPPNGPEFRLGGLGLVDLRSVAPVYQVPVPAWTGEGTAMTRNPFYAERVEGGVRFYFLPEDNTSRLFVYEASTDATS